MTTTEPFERAVTRHGPTVLRVCRAVLGPGAEALGLWEAVAALPERQRLAIAYHYLGGLRHTETAELIGGSPEAVRRAAADGMRTLRRTVPADGPATGGSR